jgi:hypothetical protein
MASKQDYENTARILRAARLSGYVESAGLRQIAKAFSRTYAADNPRFNRARFMFAAGVTDTLANIEREDI